MCYILLLPRAVWFGLPHTQQESKEDVFGHGKLIYTPTCWTLSSPVISPQHTFGRIALNHILHQNTYPRPQGPVWVKGAEVTQLFVAGSRKVVSFRNSELPQPAPHILVAGPTPKAGKVNVKFS